MFCSVKLPMLAKTGEIQRKNRGRTSLRRILARQLQNGLPRQQSLPETSGLFHSKGFDFTRFDPILPRQPTSLNSTLIL